MMSLSIEAPTTLGIQKPFQKQSPKKDHSGSMLGWSSEKGFYPTGCF